MKLFKNYSVLVLFIFAFTTLSQAQTYKDLDVSPMDKSAFPTSHNVSDKFVRVTYSRPQLKGRQLITLTPYNEVWRTGANEATEITFYYDAIFGGQPVKAGTYSLFTIPGEKEWTIIINSDVNIWGAYEYDESHDVVRVTAPVSISEDFIEAFSIAFDDNGTMYLAWGTVRVAVPIEKQ